jgi:hypothetical protein
LVERVEELETKVAALELIVTILALLNFSNLPNEGSPAGWYVQRYLLS